MRQNRATQATQEGRDLRGLIGMSAPLSTEVSWLLELAKDPTLGVDRLMRTISRDVRLGSFLMHLAASGYYGRPRSVNTLREALVVLGNQRVAMSALADRVGRAMRRRLWRYGYEPGELWRHSLGVACGAIFLLRNQSDIARSELAATAGFFHDIGKVLVHEAITRSPSMIEPAPGEQDLLACERRLAGFDHVEAGGLLLERWGLPAAVIAAVRHHHGTIEATENPDVHEAIARADCVCNRFSLGASKAGWSGQGCLAGEGSLEDEDAPALSEQIRRDVARLEQITRGMA